MKTILFLGAALCAILVPSASAAADPPRIPILIDTDIGSDIDDAFALALALSSPEVDIRGVTTVGAEADLRARMVGAMFTRIGRKDIPFAAGKDPQPASDMALQRQYAWHPAVIFNRTKKPEKEGAVEFLYARLKADPGKLTIVALGPLTNIGKLLADHPDCKPWIKRIVVMGGSIKAGYDDKPGPVVEWNIKGDIKAAQTVFDSGVPLLVVPLDATANLKLDAKHRQRILDSGTLLNYQLQAMYQLWDKETPILFDPMAVALTFDERFAKFEYMHLEVDREGFTRTGKGKANARVAIAGKGEDFLKWFVNRLAPNDPPKREPFKVINPSKLVERGNFPTRVQAVEDFETDIEKRWWMSGKLETKNVPAGSKRACRGVLTQDFDDKQGDMQAMYTAVIFNPVPGPPVGKNSRIAFRYWLKGSDRLRVQIYSLTKGYHRCLTLTNLPEGSWQTGTVDMTESRKPDGTGGPLSEDERIDDIQFYTAPGVELLIDDIVLYDAAPADEKRPFPRRIHFTGLFDTGTQGKEWPGTFEIVAKPKPLTWKAAKSVLNAKTEKPWIQLKLRGERPMGAATALSFAYQLKGAESMQVVLVNRTTKKEDLVELEQRKPGEWATRTIELTGDSKPAVGDIVDEVHFLLPAGAELLIDDVLLFEP